MPLVRCTKDGKSGWKFGKNNKSCFTGPNGKKDAIKQAIKIYGPDKFKKEMSNAENNVNKKDLLKILTEEKDLSTKELEALMIVAELTVPEVMEIFSIRAKL